MDYLFIIAVLIFSVVLHEVSHGFVANYLGDPTAKNAGRLTLNPISHLDLFGSIILPAFLILVSIVTKGGGIIFGWAKPVPINPYYFRDQQYGQLKVAMAGPASNLALALVFGLALRFLPPYFFSPAVAFIVSYIVFINIILAVFNLVPVPPLDGSHILFAFLPETMAEVKRFLYRYGFFILFAVIFFWFQWIVDITGFIFRAITGFSI
ncbi:MAG: hypothetical protein A3H01_00395 [Candidatus Wildermuthbacteria bacterium RIFCSPLOWO2_12_FULL_40_9]|uniref:Peptidase M50 domain-containing protein n=1 Tax=Candidatus Wildermuthbacteria bacterium RIFCSPLOWO2_12_FULL_40_9 TaxID=1802467 RepID=A0A1G2RTV8_9BACT|nr:MAG: hypothetical protein A3H01_00395 [Candidatus Wildermuthbacteria bacterium RIFCSPLOWO2_12_FULL_40_9]